MSKTKRPSAASSQFSEPKTENPENVKPVDTCCQPRCSTKETLEGATTFCSALSLKNDTLAEVDVTADVCEGPCVCCIVMTAVSLISSVAINRSSSLAYAAAVAAA